MRSAWVSQSNPAPWFGPVITSSHTRLTVASNEKDAEAGALQPTRAHLGVPVVVSVVVPVVALPVAPTPRLSIEAIRRR
jgi:hypothetical protein